MIPLAMTMIDWQTYIEQCQNILKVSPTRKLDEFHIDIKSPAAFLMSLNVDKNPLETLRNQGKIFEHVTCSFITQGNTEFLVNCQKSDLKIHSIKNAVGDFLVILTGNMNEWTRTLLALNEFDDFNYRKKINIALIHFEKSGFKEIWSKYSKKSLQDGTFYLRG